MSAVFQNKSGLFLIEWNLFLFWIFYSILFVKKVVKDFTFLNGLLVDCFAVIHRYLSIEDSHRLDPYQWSHLTETMASALLNFDRSIPMGDLRSETHFYIWIILYHLTDFLINLSGTSCQTAGSCTN